MRYLPKNFVMKTICSNTNFYTKTFPISNEKLLFAKNELRNLAFASFKFYNKKDHKFEN